MAGTVSCLGFIRLRVELPSVERFTATDSQSRKDLHHAAQFFPQLEMRQEDIIIVPRHGQDILSEDCLKEAVLVHHTIVNISGYNELYSRQLLPDKPDERDCIISSPLELAGTQFENLRNLSSILVRELASSTIILSSGQTFNSSSKRLFSNFQVQRNTDPPTARADALRLIYFLKKTTTKEEDQAVIKFEASFESLLSSLGRHLTCAELAYKTGKTRNDALESVLRMELWPLYVTPVAMAVLVYILIFLSSDNLSCQATVLLMISCIALPMICSAGIISMTNTSFFPTTLFIPFLLLGKAASETILFLVEWERQNKVPSLEHRVSCCFTRAGLIIAFSALCGTILFGIAIKSSFDVISEFFVATLVAYVLVSLASLAVTFILLMFFEGRWKKWNTPCLRSRSSRSRSSITSVGSIEQGVMQCQKSKLRRIVKGLTRITMSLAGKVFSLFILACILSSCVLSVLKLDERTSTSQSLNQLDSFKRFNDAHLKYFGKETDTSITFSEKIDYSLDTIQNQIINLCVKLQEASFSEGKIFCWMAVFRQWKQLQNMTCSNSEFHRCLELFLDETHNSPFRQDLRFEDTKSQARILASRIHLKIELHNRFREDRRSLEDIRKYLLEQSSLGAVPVSEKFFDLDDLFLLEREVVITVFITATVVVFMFSLFSNTSVGISLFLAATFGFLVLEAAAIMQAFGISLNHISFVSLFMTVVLSLNFSNLVANSFTFSAKLTIRDRIVEALCCVGRSVITEAFILISGSVSLGFVYPSLTEIFHRLVPLVVILGVTHALVFFPPIIALFLQLVHSFDDESDIHREPTPKEQNNKVSLQVRNGDIHHLRSKRPGISVVGISCRFPGAKSKDQFWHLLEQGKSSITAYPENRPERHKAFSELYNPKRFVTGRHSVLNGSYLKEIKHFDNTFFGISSQEARGMDPQQRILLQVVYEAIEDAGMRLEDLQKCRTGVFVGVMNLDYAKLALDPSNYRIMDPFASTGSTLSIIANRLSFCLNFTGPSLVVDTACSSSLTALKIACDNLHNDDCDIAIVCAPNIILSEMFQMASSLGGLLAPDGRSKSFDASGDGYGRGEGFAAVILKPSHAALNDKDDQYCEIVACGMNSDGQNAVPMTAPSSKMQAELSRRVLERSGVDPEDVDFFEAHGTGTAIGDVVESSSIADTYSRQRATSKHKLRIGSVKSNLNHTESTSGLAGLIKVALMIKEKKYVPTVNINVLNPKLKLEENKLVVQQSTEPWITEKGKLRIAALNSFGFGGSNVHLILREVPSKHCSNGMRVSRLNDVLTLSARSKEALQQMARLYSDWIKKNAEVMDERFVEDLCYSLNERRSQFPHRLALAFGSTVEASKSLAEYADDSVGWDKLVSYAEVKSNDTKLVFMFGGQGSQWYAMGRQLIECEVVFREAVLTVSNLLNELGMKWSLMDELMAPEDISRVSENYIAFFEFLGARCPNSKINTSTAVEGVFSLIVQC